MTTPDHMPNTLSEAQRMITELRGQLAKPEQDWGGSAFPVSDGVDTDWGMTLRDYFAGLALGAVGTWMPMGSSGDLSDPKAILNRAQWAYAQADAMLAARVAS